jgi:site-specific recombinase XerD
MQAKQPLIPLSTLVEGFIFTLKAEGKTPATVRYYQGNLRRFQWYVKQQAWPDDAKALDRWKLRQFLDYAGSATNRWGTTGNGSESCRKPPTTNGWRYYRTLKRFFNWAVDECLLEENPMAKVRMKPPRDRPVEPYNPSELGKLVAVCDQAIANGSSFTAIRNKATILLFLDTGMRLCELGNLRLCDVDMESGRIAVMGKGGYPGIVAFQLNTKKALWKYLAFRQQRVKGNAESWLWITEEGERLSVAGIHIAVRRIKERAGIASPGTVHKLRHTFAITALRGLKDPFLLQLLLRHKDLTMTRRYTAGLRTEEALEAHREASPVDRLGLG